MWKRSMWMTALFLTWATTDAVAGDLSVGDPAPKLAVKEFVKGDTIAGLENGKTYVVEFWATWCGPCRKTIPHLTDLQKRHRDVVFIGVSIDHDTKAVKPFVEEMGDKMDYRVALDDVPGGGKSNGGTMASTWMKAAGQEGIPTAFIVNGDGKIAWVGHPMAIDKPLAEVAAGTWDLAAASTQFKREQARSRKIQELNTKLTKAARSGDSQELLKALDEAIADSDDGDLTAMLAYRKFLVLADKGGDPGKAYEYGKRLIDSTLKDNPNALFGLARSVVGPVSGNKPEAKLVPVALAAAQRADQLMEGKNAQVADTLARAYFLSGDTAKALECQERAVRLAKGTRMENDKEMQKRLAEYKNAAEKTPGSQH
jgi:thiol-disulfide isomerase/thioredoxin